MRSLRTVLLAAVVVSRSVEAWGATEEEKFLGVFKKFGVSENSLTSKKPCLCVGAASTGERAVWPSSSSTTATTTSAGCRFSISRATKWVAAAA